MSDNITANTVIPIKPLVRKDEQGNTIGQITPILKVVARGEMEGSIYPTIEVTQGNLNDYVKVRGLEHVLEVLNARERLNAQATLEYIIDREDAWEEIEGMTDKEGKPRAVWTYIQEKFISVIDKFYETLLQGKVRGGVTIKDLMEEQEELMTEMQNRLNEVMKIAPDQIKNHMLKTNELSMKYNDLKEQIAEIKKARKPRITKKEKAEALLAAKVAAAPVTA